MKSKFTKSWKASKQPRKQRKFIANAPLHIKKNLLGVNLSKELRKIYGKRNIVVRKGDTIKILRGKFRGKKGKVTNVNIKFLRIFVQGIQIKKQDGSKVSIKLHPSNLQIIELNTEDRKRGLISKNIKTEGKKEIKIDKDKIKTEEKK